jgi:glycosyltransferase involved in cell wall biosynthesis
MRTEPAVKVLILSPQFPSPALPLNGVRESAFLRHLPEFDIEPRTVVPLPLRRSPLHGAVRHVPATEQSGGTPVVHPRYIGLPRQLVSRGYAKPLETWLYRRGIRGEVEAFQRKALGGVFHVHSCVTAGYSLISFPDPGPMVVTVHDSDLQTSILNSRLHPLITATLRRAGHVIYQSTKLQSIGQDLIGDHACSIIPWGVNTYDNVERRRPQVFTVTAVARLIPTKGLDILIRGFSKLLELLPKAQAQIIGEGPDRARLERLIAQLGVAESVTLVGPLPNQEVISKVAGSSLFVLPSHVEALGTAYLEAMSVGIPVVGVQGQGISDVISDGQNGLLVPPRNEEAVFEAMKYIANNQDMAEALGLAAQETFRTGPFSWRRNAELHANLYRSMSRARSNVFSNRQRLEKYSL